MLVERIEGKWIDCFAEVFGMCAVEKGQTAAILSETQSRAVNVNLAELALEGDMGLLNQIGLTSPSHPDYRRLTSAEALDNP